MMLRDNFEQSEHFEEFQNLIKELCKVKGGFLLARYVDQIIAAFFGYTSSAEEKLFARMLKDVVLPNWIRRFDSFDQMENETGKQLTLQEHCYKLSMIIYEIEQYGEFSEYAQSRNNEVLTWSDAAEWLDVAASIKHVSVLTGYYNDSLMWCGDARDYEDERSELMAHLTTQLAIFSFVWGSLETVIKVINPPKIPKNLKPGQQSPIDQAIFFLKNEYEPEKLLTFYNETTAELRETLENLSYNDSILDLFKLKPYLGISGVGISVVRRFRNKFAHGTLTMPIPRVKEELQFLDAKVIALSTRMTLLTIQMLLVAHLKGHYFDIERYDDFGDSVIENIYHILRKLHLRPTQTNEFQLPLFQF